MKKLILFIAIITLIGGCNSSDTDTVFVNANTTLSIEGMVCEENCASYIERKITKLEGVKSCEVDLESKLATIIYNDDKVASTKFVDLVEGLNESQYKVSNINTEKISTSNSENSSSDGEETGSILSAPSFELPNIMEYLRNII